MSHHLGLVPSFFVHSEDLDVYTHIYIIFQYDINGIINVIIHTESGPVNKLKLKKERKMPLLTLRILVFNKVLE